METASDVIGVAGAALFPIRGRLPLMPHSERLAEGFDIYIRDGWIDRDERYRAVPAALRKGVATEFDFTTPEEIERSPYYQEFLAPLGFRWFSAVLIGEMENQWSLSFQRTIKQGPFPKDDLDELARLLPRLNSVVALARALGFAAVSGALEAFELSGTAVVQIDSAGRVICLNIAAEALIGRGIAVIKGRLVAEQRDATEALERTLSTLLWRGGDTSLMPPVPLPRAGRKPLLAYPLGLTSVSDNPFARCRALLVVIDPEQKRRSAEALLASLFRLTPAESRLAVRLANGETIQVSSEVLGITKSTARNQLKAVFAKTRVHRQAELVSLVATLVGQLF